MPTLAASAGFEIETSRPWTTTVPPSFLSAPTSARATSVRPGTHEAGEAEDLAAAHLEADVAQQGLRAQPRHRQDRLAERRHRTSAAARP